MNTKNAQMEKTYQEKITTLLAEIAYLKKKSDQISMFRLLLIIGLLVVVYQLFKLNEIVGGLSIIGGILGFYYGQNMYGTPFLFLILGLILGALGTLTMFGYRLFFDYLLMRAHQSKL